MEDRATNYCMGVPSATPIVNSKKKTTGTQRFLKPCRPWESFAMPAGLLASLALVLIGIAGQIENFAQSGTSPFKTPPTNSNAKRGAVLTMEHSSRCFIKASNAVPFMNTLMLLSFSYSKPVARRNTAIRHRTISRHRGRLTNQSALNMKTVTLLRHPKQKRFLESQRTNVLLRGGRGSGKTQAGAMLAQELMIKYPDVLGLIGANTFAQLNKYTVAKLIKVLNSCGIKYVIGKRPPSNWKLYRELKDYDGIITLRNGGQAVLASLERYDTAVRGGDLGWAWLDETRDTAPEAIDVVFGAFRGYSLAHPGWVYKLRITTTPNGFDHIWERFASGIEGKQLPDSEDIHCHTADNIYEPGFADRLLSTYSKQLAAQEVEGEYVNMSTGRAFEFSRDRNLSKQQYDPSLPLLLTMDFNVAPLCALVMQIDKIKRTASVLEEIYIPDNGQTREACNVFLQHWSDKKPLVWFFGDVAGEHRDTRGNRSDIAIMQETLGMSAKNVTGPKGKVKNGINAVNAMLNPAKGLPRLMIDPKCQMLTRDLEQVSWKPGTTELDKSNGLLTHMADGLRYPIAEFFPVTTEQERNLERVARTSIYG